MKKPLFITFEGCEGCGKSTQAKLLADHVKRRGRSVVLTREPGGTRLAEAIRTVLLDPKNIILPRAELMLYEASRAQHVEEIIHPALKAGKIVICDRFTDATLAYQGYGRGLDLRTIRELNRTAADGLVPDLTIYLDIPAESGLKKAKTLKHGGDRLEREALSFHRRVREGYLALAKKEPRRIVTIKTASSKEETHSRIKAAVSKYGI